MGYGLSYFSPPPYYKSGGDLTPEGEISMIYKTEPRYMLVVDGSQKGTYYFGRKPSAQDFIKHNCQGHNIELFERDRDGAYQTIYEASIDENGKAFRYSGKELPRKEEVA